MNKWGELELVRVWVSLSRCF